MIRRELWRQLYRAEQLDRRADAKRQFGPGGSGFTRAAESHGTDLAAVLLYGTPKIDEPLLRARERAFNKVVELYADEVELEYGHNPDSAHPSMREALCLLVFRLDLGPDLRRVLEELFSRAPDWLLKFCAAEVDAKLLNFHIRDFASAPGLSQGARRDRQNWPSLPVGTIAAGEPSDEPDYDTEQLTERVCSQYADTMTPKLEEIPPPPRPLKFERPLLWKPPRQGY